MTQIIYRDLLQKIEKKELIFNQQISLEITESYQMTVYLNNLLTQLKEHVSKHGFTCEKEEIEFFKKIKPQILGKLMFYNKLYRIQSISTPENINSEKYYHKQLDYIRQENKKHFNNTDFYQYYKSERTDRDQTYFRLNKINLHNGLNSFAFEIDHQFSTYYDYKLAKIIANELLYDYFHDKIITPEVNMNNKINSQIVWSDSKNAMIELIYALHACGVVSNGNLGIRQLALLFQMTFNISLNDIHHAFHRMKTRPQSRTSFIDKLKKTLEQYMDKDLQ